MTRRGSPLDWPPRAGAGAIRARAELLGRIRSFFAEAGVLEVETPIASGAAATDPALESLQTRWSAPGSRLGSSLYLQTSPELAMKRLLAAGLGPIFQVCKVFRDGERGRLHHPEFTLLEWYRPGWGYGRLMDEVAALVRVALDRPAMAIERIAYRDLFLSGLNLDPTDAPIDALRSAAEAADIGGASSLRLHRDGWLDLLLTHCLEPRLGRKAMTFVHDYPASQAALARIRAGDPPVAERFELYIDGVELANGFQELRDAREQRRRFESEQATRRREGRHVPPVDERFLAALAAGFPDCAGVALGVDRLLMIAVGAGHIDEVLAFPVERA